MELHGVADGGSAAGCPQCGDYASRAIVLANAPGDLQVIYVYMYIHTLRCLDTLHVLILTMQYLTHLINTHIGVT